MSEPGYEPFDQPDLDDVARAERFIDAVAKRQPVEFSDVTDQGDTGDRALAGLLEDWRDELRVPAASGLCPEWEAVGALNRGLAARRRTRRSVALVSALAATVLGIGGFVATLGEARPGDTLYGVHTKMFGEPASVHDARVASSAQTDLDLVEQMITLGRWDEAQDKLAAVSDRVQTVKDGDRKQDLIDKVNLLNAKVATRDRNATPAPSSLPSAAPATLVPSGGPGTTSQQPEPVGG
jgi:Anti-sigma-D factor RsdA to sigma factor binding region